PPPTSADRRLLTALRETVAGVAQSLNLPEGLLCPRRHLESLVAERAWPVALEGWRKPLLHDALMARVESGA
ncbi:MAG: ribonuclease D, partial [Deltaproteobacteria bacterium]